VLSILTVTYMILLCRHEDAMRALEASREKRFFGSKVTVSVHEGLGKIIIIVIIIVIFTT